MPAPLHHCYVDPLPAVSAAPSASSATRAAAVPIAIAVASATSTTAASGTSATLAATASATRSAAIARLIDFDPASFEVGFVEGLDRFSRAFLIRHLDEPETSRLAGKLVGHHDRFLDRADLREQLRQVFIGNCVGEITYVQLAGHRSPPSELVPELLNGGPCQVLGVRRD
jgi:hypothetical protein